MRKFYKQVSSMKLPVAVNGKTVEMASRSPVAQQGETIQVHERIRYPQKLIQMVLTFYSQ